MLQPQSIALSPWCGLAIQLGLYHFVKSPRIGLVPPGAEQFVQPEQVSLNFRLLGLVVLDERLAPMRSASWIQYRPIHKLSQVRLTIPQGMVDYRQTHRGAKYVPLTVDHHDRIRRHRRVSRRQGQHVHTLFQRGLQPHLGAEGQPLLDRQP